MDHSARWTCPTCCVIVTTPFCAGCGEEPLPPRGLTLHGMAEKLLHAVTSIDARVARTANVLLRSPGRLTRAWVDGMRKPYVAPFQLFLIANVIFFAVQSLTGETVFSSSLDSHLHHQDWSGLAREMVDARLAATGTSAGQLAPIFDRVVVLNAKSFIVVMAGAFALLLPLVFVRERRPFMTHVAFSLHLYTFLLLLFCVALLAGKASALLGFGGLETAGVDNVLSVVNVAACATYLYLSIGPVYGTYGAARIVQTAVLSVAVAAIVLGYRFLIFVITLYGA